MTNQVVAVFGLGIIGSRCAANLTKAGYDVVTWNRTPKGGVTDVASPAEAAAKAKVLAFYLKDGVALRDTFDQLRDELTPGHVVMNHSTVDVETTHAIALACAEIGCGFLDCPFTGSKDASAAGQLVYYVGGDEALIERMRPVLEATSKEVKVIGGVGSATVIKIATNLISAQVVQALSEAMALTVASGVDSQVLIDAVASNACGSVLAKMKMPAMAAGDYDTHFSVDNMRKDSAFALELAAQVGLELPGIRVANQVMTERCEAGDADLDYSAMYRQFARKAPDFAR